MTGIDHAVNTFADEMGAFTQRHKDLDAVGSAFGGLVWGFMRALAECPDCPGTFRIPTDKDWTNLICPKCQGVWTYDEEAAKRLTP